MSVTALVTSVVPALLPAVSDGIRGIIARVTGGKGAKPLNIAEAIQLMQAENQRLEILARLDTPGDVSRWVANLRALQRPALATWILALYAGAVLFKANQPVIDQLGQAANMVTFYLFGHWGYSAVKASR